MTKKETEKQPIDKLGLSEKDQLKGEELESFTAETGEKIKALRDKIHEQIVNNDKVVKLIIANSDRIRAEGGGKEKDVVVRPGLTLHVGGAKKDPAKLRNLIFRREYLERFVGEPDEAAIEAKTAELVELMRGEKDLRNPLLGFAKEEIEKNRANLNWGKGLNIEEEAKTKAQVLQEEILALMLKGSLPRQILTDYDQLKSEVDNLISQYYYLVDKYTGRGASIDETKQKAITKALLEKAYDLDPSKGDFPNFIMKTASNEERSARAQELSGGKSLSEGRENRLKQFQHAKQRLGNKGNTKPTFDEQFVEYKRYMLEKAHKEARTEKAALLTEEVRNQATALLAKSLAENKLEKDLANLKGDFSIFDAIEKVTGEKLKSKDIHSTVREHLSMSASVIKEILAEANLLKTDSSDENVGQDSKTT